MTSTVMAETGRTVPVATIRDATALPRHSLPVGVTPQPRLGLHVADTCMADCYRCGIHNRLFVVTDRGVFTRCFSCHDEWRSTDAPWSCEHPQGFAPAPAPPRAPDVRIVQMRRTAQPSANGHAELCGSRSDPQGLTMEQRG